MQQSVPVVLLAAALLVVAGAGIASLARPAPALGAAAPEAAGHDHAGHAHGEPAAQHGSGAHPWSGGTGAIPTLADALLTLERRASITIAGDKAFNPANGVRSGSGTFDDPYVIRGWYVDTVVIKDTSKAFVFTENYVGNILVLDWTGKGGYVHHNHLDNLRTNRNVARTGDPSATVIESNVILRIEQLRHFDGEVRNNTIGEPDPVKRLLQPDVAFDIAGLNGAGIHDNVIFGGVDMKIHGHHHSDAPGRMSHNHGEGHANDTYADGSAPDHQVRYVEFHFYRNHLVDDGFGLRYNDLNHAGDDRQATSEQNPDLEKPHVHHTNVSIHDNVVEGATLRVAVLNSLDSRHLAGESATLTIANNRILKPAAGDGLVVQDVRNATVRLSGNLVEKGSLQLAGASAILLARFSNATVLVEGNELGAYQYGVRASKFDNLTRWVVAGNQAPGVSQAVYWDDSVANAPEGAPKHEEHGHGHGHADAVAPARSVLRL